ncbi:hypothetical protein GDO78_002037 [Eleutherodactylus coqui]|uniref:Uncharacterized protein n=1 Tax=Eleutherodactylus coqui TaxID=57060 RepID=A0A8J6FVK0_ELECQ|nr:hypothetical protein GDO78_002037 [Eleutherodactylus coqui]KAG9494507.1 hypothetical protein GDO78_002037 [Eleutherodactylus coqui]
MRTTLLWSYFSLDCALLKCSDGFLDLLEECTLNSNPSWIW